MKKLLTTLSLMGVAGAMSFGVALGVNQTAKEAKATDPESYIEMSTTFFTNWTDNAGTVKDVGATFWDDNYSFEALGKFYSGESKEGWTGTLTSRTWKQSTPYIYFQLGAAMDYRVDGDNAHDDLPDAGNPVYLKIHAGSKTYDFYNNTFVENPMTLRYFEIPAADFVELTEESADFDMSIDVVDPKTRNYGFANFGYLHVNQTRTQVGDAMRYFINHLSSDMREWEINKRKAILNTYWDNAYQKAIFFESAGDNIDDNFNSNSDFLNHWYFDYNYFNNDGTARHFDTAISTFTYRPDDGHNVPFNNNDGYFKGWYAGNTGNTGFTETDGAIYRFRSRPFVLNTLGLISIRMAGRAASLHVIDVATNSVLGWVDVNGKTTYQSSGGMDNIAESGFNTCTLTNYVINLEAYAGRTIQLAIADVFDSDWAAAYFDDLVTSYTSLSDFGFKVDTSTQTRNDTSTYAVYPDYYVSSTWSGTVSNGFAYDTGNAINTVDPDDEGELLPIKDRIDSSSLKDAYNVWKSYIDTVRNGKVGSNYCSDIVSDANKNVINAYNALSEEAKTIVCNSDDFERVGSTAYTTNPTIYNSEHEYNIGRSIANIANKNGMNAAAYGYAGGNNYGVSMDASSIIAILVSISAIALLGIMLLSYRKRKEK